MNRRTVLRTSGAAALGALTTHRATHKESPVAPTPIEIVQEFLANTTNADVVRRLVAPDATYISLNFDDPELKRILPWAGSSTGPDVFIFTFAGVARFWTIEDFQITSIFGSGEDVAVFGTFTYRSNTLGKVVTSPLSIHARVAGGQITYFQFMEDTYATAGTFRSGGTWTIHADPDGTPFVI